MPNPLITDQLNLSGQNVTAVNNALYVNGVNAIMGVSGSAATTNLLTVPVSINVYGGIDVLAGRPAGFLNVTVSGINVKIPFYT